VNDDGGKFFEEDFSVELIRIDDVFHGAKLCEIASHAGCLLMNKKTDCARVGFE
jgi:hypothetical protein